MILNNQIIDMIKWIKDNTKHIGKIEESPEYKGFLKRMKVQSGKEKQTDKQYQQYLSKLDHLNQKQNMKGNENYYKEIEMKQ